MDHTQVNLIQLKTSELGLYYTEYIQYTDVRIADLSWVSYIPSTGQSHSMTVGFV